MMKTFKLNLLLSALALNCAQTNSLLFASDNENNFCGLNKGFFDQVKKTTSSSSQQKEITKLKEKQKKESAQYYFWEDQRYSPEKNLSRTPVLNLWESGERYNLKRTVFPAETESLTVEKSLSTIYQFFIALHSHDSNTFRKIHQCKTVDEIPPINYSFLIEGDRIIKFLLQNQGKRSPLQPGAADDYGVLIFQKGFWEKSEELYNVGHRYEQKNPPIYSYYSFHDMEGELRYIVYNLNTLSKFKFEEATYYIGKGLETITSKNNSSNEQNFRLAQNTFILDKNMKLVPARNQLAIILGRPFKNDVSAHAYIQDPKTEMPYLVQLSDNPENFFEISEDLDFLIDMIGNKKTLEEYKFLFSDISVFSSRASSDSEDLSDDDTFTPDRAITFLKYALPMLEMYENNPQEFSLGEEKHTRNSIKEKLLDAVENATQVLVESPYKEVFKKEIKIAESQSEVNDKALEEKVKIEIEKFTEDRKKSLPNENSKKLKKAVRRKKAKLKEIHRKKEPLSTAKEKTYRIIHEEILKDLRGKKHISTSQMRECLGRLVDGFIQRNDTLLSIDSHVMRGDHAGTKVINVDSGHKETVSLALRNQKKGYKVGTARKIIADNFEKLLNLALRPTTHC